jgi:hypothetical protein
MVTTNQVIDATKTIVQAATGLDEVYAYIPTTLNTTEVIFLYAEPPTQEIKSNNLTRITYHVMIWVLVQYVGSDDTAADLRFNDVTDAAWLALVENKTLNGTVRSTSLNDVNHNPLVEIDRVIYRARLWSLEAWEDRVTTFS